MSHCAKPLCKMLAAAISPQYNSAMPEEQTSLLTTLVTVMEVCSKREKSFFRFVCGLGHSI